jgi:Flp pilus assembly protein TadG
MGELRRVRVTITEVDAYLRRRRIAGGRTPIATTDSKRCHAHRSHGQTLPLVILFMFGVLGMSALAIDVASWYQQKQALQAAADAAALAGASQLPAGWGAAQTAANHAYSRNGRASDAVTVSLASDLGANDSVVVTAGRRSPGFFVRILGISSVNLSVSARATVESYTTFVSTGNVMPFAVMQGDYTLGTSYTIFGDGSSSNNGSISPDIRAGSGCAAAHGASDLGDTISGAEIACPISTGDVVETKTGHSTGQVAQGLNDRMSSTWKSFDQIVQPDGNGHYTLLDPSSPQLVVIPVVVNMSGGTTWPTGHSSVRVVGFAWFVITGCGNPTKPGPCSNSDGKWVNGTFVSLIDTNTEGTTGAWNPSTTSTTTVELTA